MVEGAGAGGREEGTRRVLIWEKLDRKIVSDVIFELRPERGMNQRPRVREFHAEGAVEQAACGQEGEKGGQCEWSTVAMKEPAVRLVQKGRPLPFSSRGAWVLF